MDKAAKCMDKSGEIIRETSRLILRRQVQGVAGCHPTYRLADPVA